jgi:DNA-directed RNA polymerase subunit RPC12/RpoP
MQPVPVEFAGRLARCPACSAEGSGVVGVIALRLVFRCAGCGVKFHRTEGVLIDAVAR